MVAALVGKRGDLLVRQVAFLGRGNLRHLHASRRVLDDALVAHREVEDQREDAVDVPDRGGRELGGVDPGHDVHVGNISELDVAPPRA